MEQIFDYTIPVLHPILVHFPIVLTLAAAFCAVVWLVRDRIKWLKSSIFVLAFAWVGALAAYLTGETMEEQSEGVPVVEALVETHESLGLASLWMLGICTLAAAGTLWYVRQDTSRSGASTSLRAVIALLLMGAAVLVALTAHLGGLMVWGVAV